MRSYDGAGRLRPDDEDCSLRTPFQRDRDRIVHCKAFRRLKHKTQVFIAPQGDHFRTRLTHTLEVSGISRGVARALRLNEDLTEAIALGHDLGHAPFGHTGEEAIDRVLRRYDRRFRHNEHSLRIVDVLERDGRGLNLTAEVRDGILQPHRGRPARHARGRDRAPRRPLRLRQPRHRRRACGRASSTSGDLPPEPVAPAGRHRRRSGSTRSCTTWSSTRETAGEVHQSQPMAEALLGAALRSCSSTSTWARSPGRETSAAADMVEALLVHYIAPPTTCPATATTSPAPPTGWRA